MFECPKALNNGKGGNAANVQSGNMQQTNAWTGNWGSQQFHPMPQQLNGLPATHPGIAQCNTSNGRQIELLAMTLEAERKEAKQVAEQWAKAAFDQPA